MTENIQEKDLSGWFEKGFKSYGMSVIKDRAFVDIRDGLKPVHRAIIYEILRLGATSDSKPTKVARISGNVIGNWHPHGDKAVEDALTGLAQSWTNSLPVVRIKGNGGTVFGDGAAAGRYIEARMTPAGDAYGHNLKKGIVPFIPNFDETDEMPVILPAQLPYVLINGISEGIAVGVSSTMPPHNPKEVLEMTIAWIRNPSMTTAELLEIMPGPDFPTAATIINRDDMEQIYQTGAGRILVRATLEYNKSDHALHVREIPFNFSGSMNNLVAELATMTSETVSGKKKIPPKVPGITKVEDYSGKNGIDICLYLQRGVDPEEVKKILFAKTRLECRVPFLFNALNDREAHQYSLKQYLSEYLDFQHEIILNEHRIELESLEEKLEIVIGRMVASQCMDAVIDLIRQAESRAQIMDVLMHGTILKNTDPQYQELVSTFAFTERQAEAIADMKLYQLAKTDRQKLTEDGKVIKERISEVQQIMENEEVRKELIISRLQTELAKLPDCPRKTVITQDTVSSAAGMETKAVPVFLSMDRYGYIRMEGKYFENAVETDSKARVGFFDVSGNCWNLYLDRMKETKDRGILISRLIDTEAQIIGFTTAVESEDREGLFIFEDGSMRRVVMNRYMTKTRRTKIETRTPDAPMKAYFDIPDGMNIVIVDEKKIPLSRIPLQSCAGTGKKFLEPKEEPYAVSFGQEETVPEEPADGRASDAVVTFTQDGKLLFDWTTSDTEGHEGLYVTTYQELLASTLLFVHRDGTAKRVRGELFAVKTRRTQIKAAKDGVDILTILPVPETGYLIGHYHDGYQKCVTVEGISFQGITGGGIRVFHTQKYTLETVEFTEKPEIPAVSFATQPKQYAQEKQNDTEDGYVRTGMDGYSCLNCGKDLGPDDPVRICPECGGMFCRDCAENGALDDHECDPDYDEEQPFM